jgi:phenylalanyl-tRNA synthetase beta chain
VEREDGRLLVTVPTFRRDLRREADLVEEVGRLVGLDKVPEKLPGVPQPGGLTGEQRKMRLLRHVLADLGFAESLTYPFGPERWAETLGEAGDTVRITNPLSVEGSNMRTTILPGLLDAAARNRAFGARGGGLFEVGHVFIPEPPPEGLREAALRFRMTGEIDGDSLESVRATEALADEGVSSALMGVREEARVGAVLAGTVRPATWNAPELRAGFFEAKGVVERLVPGAAFEPEPRPFLHPGRSAVVLAEGETVGWVGELHPEVAGRFELDEWRVAAFELDLALCDPDPTPHFEAFVNVPAVNRDLAVVVDARVPVGKMLAAIEALRSSILVETRVFDVYEGPQVPEGHKSVALSFTFQGEQTLTDEDVNAEIERISVLLEKQFGARLRA